MKNYKDTLLVSILLCSSLQAFQDTELTEKFLTAIESSDKDCVEQLIKKHDIQHLLTQKQKEALWDTTCATIRHRKAHLKTVFGLRIDISHIKQAALFGFLGVSSILLGNEMVPDQEGDDEIELEPRRHSSSNKDAESWLEVFKIRAFLRNSLVLPKSLADTLIWAGIGSLGCGLWKMVQAFHLYELSKAQAIKKLMHNILFKEQKAETQG